MKLPSQFHTAPAEVPVRSGINRERAAAAFTMVEIALCLAIIGFALVAIIGVLPVGMSAQKDNREETVVNLDANYLMDALSNGSRGADELTNAAITITNTFVHYDFQTNLLETTQNIFTSTNFALYVPAGGKPKFVKFSYLSSASNIVGILSTPKYLPSPRGGFYSNYTVADFRAMSSSLVEQGTNQTGKEFSFHYRVVPEFSPYAGFDQSWTNNSPDATAQAINLQTNLTQLRLRFNWPVLPNGGTGNNRLVFRTMVSGSIQGVNVPSVAGGGLYFVQPHTFTSAP